jgi:predicted PurR-regulated permease PerM
MSGDDGPTVDGDGGPTVDGDGGPTVGERLAGAVRNTDVRRDRLGLWLVAFLFIGVVVFITWKYVGTVILGLFVYYVTRPVFQRIHYRVESRTLSVVASLVAGALPVLLLVAWTLAIAVRSLSEFLDESSQGELVDLVEPYVDLTGVVADLRDVVRQVVADPARVTDLNLGPVLSDATDVVLSSLGTLFNAALHGFIVLIIAFYLLRDDYRIAAWARETFIPDDSVLEHYFVAVDRDLKNVFFGNILNALVTGLLGAVIYVLLNVFAPPEVAIPEPALVGLLVGAGSLVPVIGMKIVWVPIALFLTARSLLLAPETLWFPLTFAAVSVVVVDYIPDQLLRPYVSGRTLHVGAVMLAYTVGPLLFGWYGIFLGPFVLVVVFEFGRLLFPWLVSGTIPDVAPLAVDEPADTDEESVDERRASVEEAPVDDAASTADPSADDDTAGTTDGGEPTDREEE